LIIRTIENETELEENTAVGVRALYLTIVDTDAYEDHVFTMTGATDYFELTIVNTEKSKYMYNVIRYSELYLSRRMQDNTTRTYLG
jgi:hypothetical protein